MKISEMLEIADVNYIEPKNWREDDGRILWKDEDGKPNALVYDDDLGKLYHLIEGTAKVIWDLREKVRDFGTLDATFAEMTGDVDHMDLEGAIQSIHVPALEEYEISLEAPDLPQIYMDAYNERRQEMMQKHQ